MLFFNNINIIFKVTSVWDKIYKIEYSTWSTYFVQQVLSHERFLKRNCIYWFTFIGKFYY